MIKKNFIIIFVISAGITVGVFLFVPASKTLYIKNNAPFLASATNLKQPTNQENDKIGDLSNTIIPSIKNPRNITEDFAANLTRQIISKNDNIQVGDLLPGPGFNVPNPGKIAEDFIKNGLKKANENILNIKSPKFNISSDNSKASVESYLADIQKILNNNLKEGDSLISILEDIQKNNGVGIEKLYPVITAHEIAASQIEERPVPSSLKNLITGEVRLLKITANVLRALTNIENDPLGTITATRQFGDVLQNWADLQKKFDSFILVLNKT